MFLIFLEFSLELPSGIVYEIMKIILTKPKLLERYIMRLITGGAFQGKTEYALNVIGISRDSIIDGADCRPKDIKNALAINHFHLFVKRLLLDKADVQKEVEDILIENPDIIILVDELGCGVVPIDAFDRNYREVTGRICCYLAKEAKEVDHVICGIGQVIKHD